MKAFISHSSKDKEFVEKMVGELRPGTYELDAHTFDFGLINSAAISESLKRCNLFCLILSEHSFASSYVDFETLLGIEFFARGKIDRFVALCIDDKAFASAAENVKYFNVVRKFVTPESAARLIQGQLISAINAQSKLSHPFIGRNEEIAILGRQINDHRRPPSKAVFISGNSGSGRRTIAENFFRQYFPQVGRIFPRISIGSFSGLEELYREVLKALRPTMSVRDFATRIQSFTIASEEEKLSLIADLLNSLQIAREAALVVDEDGVLTDSGCLTAEIDALFSHLNDNPHPSIIFISSRMIPRKYRRVEDDISYLAVRSLSREATRDIILRLFKDIQVTLTDESLEILIELCDSHPYNIYRMIDEVQDRGLDPFLANPTEYINWKHRQSSEYLKGVKLSEIEKHVLAILKILPELDFSSIIEALELDGDKTSEATLRLTNLHILENRNQCFVVSPALRVAVERDRRIQLPETVRRNALVKLASSLVLRLEDGTAPVQLIDSTVLASLQAGEEISELAGAFLLPSHHIWIAKRSYDERKWHDCIRFSHKALEGRAQLSSSGFVGACRLLCLAAARIGDDQTFQQGLSKLKPTAMDDWSKSNVSFLQGFNSRLKGHLPNAEVFFREAYNLSPGNFSAARELASVYLDLDKLDEAEIFARET
ncbi:MAG: TIR domain-containing protein [Rhodospirillaceae bacterium]|nr:TIR domain-containing protein [Rhodospirillaceae bacterium]MYH38851.1 TIR domain-containing protein [Rhodospirillaceae bacterium]MYK16448.1 TIR domain-containing protein [Rhodospirillaceae bacterium]